MCITHDSRDDFRPDDEEKKKPKILENTVQKSSQKNACQKYQTSQRRIRVFLPPSPICRRLQYSYLVFLSFQDVLEGKQTPQKK